MFNIGGGEVLVIALVALIVVGPEQLPGVLRKAGQYASQLRTMSDGVRREFMAGVDEVDPNKWVDPSDTKPQSNRGDGSADNPIVPRGFSDTGAAKAGEKPPSSDGGATASRQVAPTDAAAPVTNEIAAGNAFRADSSDSGPAVDGDPGAQPEAAPDVASGEDDGVEA